MLINAITEIIIKKAAPKFEAAKKII